MKILCKRELYLVACLLITIGHVHAQVGIGPVLGTVNGSASLEVKAGPYSAGSPYRGLLIPTVTTDQRNQIQNPAAGLLIFNTNTKQIEVNTSSNTTPTWTPGGVISASSTGLWSLTGNAGTVNGASFLGTVDNVPLSFRVNNVSSGRIDQSQSNVSLGFSAAGSITTGQQNVAFGTYALRNSTTGSYNTALGTRALEADIDGYENTATGALTLQNNTSGFRNTAVGTASLEFNKTGNYNTAVGKSSLQNNTTGYENTAVGSSAASGNTTGYSNVAVGQDALTANTDGHDNTALGASALLSNTNGQGNMASGVLSMLNNTTGQANTASGGLAMRYNVTGSNNTALGFDAGPGSNAININNSIAIGAHAVVNASNEIVLGDNNITALRCNVQTISSLSDKRIKEDVKANIPGLRFITKLTPVTYHINKVKEAKLVGYSVANTQEDKTLHSGFLAQDVETAAKEVGYDFEGVRQQEGGKYYTLGYTLFVIPLVQAVKDLNSEVEGLKAALQETTANYSQLSDQVKQLQGLLGLTKSAVSAKK